MRIKLIKSFIAAVILLIVFGCHRNPAVESFTADMVQKKNNQRVEGKLFVKGNKYRMDMKEGEDEISVLVNRKSGIQKIIIHSQKAAYEDLNTSPKSLSNNPFESFYHLREKNSSRKKGSEVINGYECRKIEVYEKDTILMTAWVSNKLNWPIKIETEAEPQKDVILENIKEEPVEENLFELPEGYRLYPHKTTILAKLEENGVKYKTNEGTIEIRAFGASVLGSCFPGWSFFLISREKDEKPTSGNIPKMQAAISRDGRNIYILYSLETDTSINNVLKMSQDQNIKLNNEKDVKVFGNALFFLFFRNPRIEDVESLGENKWTIYKRSASVPEYLDGLIVNVNDSGEITELNYKSKIKKK